MVVVTVLVFGSCSTSLYGLLTVGACVFDGV